MPRQYPHILCGAIYHSPKAPKVPMTQHIHYCLNYYILQKHPTAGILVMGDFNTLPHGKLCRSYKLKQVVTTGTRHGSVLDEIITNMHELYSTLTVHAPLGLSDHGVVIYQPQPSCSKSAPPPKTITKRKCTHSTKSALTQELMTVNWTPLFQLETCQENFQFFQDHLDMVNRCT